MSNEFYNYPANIPQQGVAKPLPIIDNFRAIERAFDLLGESNIEAMLQMPARGLPRLRHQWRRHLHPVLARGHVRSGL